MRRKDREVKDIKSITEIFKLCKTANIAMIDNGVPYVLPLSYGYELNGNSLVLYFHSAKVGRKIDVLNNNNRVCFSIFSEGEPLTSEIPCNSGYYYSSIIGYGTAEFIEAFNEKGYALSKIFEQQTGKKIGFSEEQTKSVAVFKIIVSDYTAKQKAEKK